MMIALTDHVGIERTCPASDREHIVSVLLGGKRRLLGLGRSRQEGDGYERVDQLHFALYYDNAAQHDGRHDDDKIQLKTLGGVKGKRSSF